MSKSQPRRIKTHTDSDMPKKISIDGWLAGRQTYLWIGSLDGEKCLGCISGHKLYRLAKAIVKQYEGI